MEIGVAAAHEWQAFLAAALGESWRIPDWESEFFRRWPRQGAFVLREADVFAGLITAVGFGRTGWIGNLLVPKPFRGRGNGTRLFRHALDVLETYGAESLWLTASEMGLPLYRKQGFREVERVERWVRQAPGVTASATIREGDCETLRRRDAEVWGEPRPALLDLLIRDGRVLASGDTLVLLQEGSDLQVLGPWISPTQCPRENRQVLLAALAAARDRVELIVDVLGSAPARDLLPAAGFRWAGTNRLMVRGRTGREDLEPLVSLASLGSLG